MKKNAIFLFLLFVMTISGAYISRVGAIDHADDTPLDEGGNGFGIEDECGFIYGESNRYNDFKMSFTNVEPDDWQACVDVYGEFYDLGAMTNTTASGYYAHGGGDLNDINHRISLRGDGYSVQQQADGEWTGYGRIFGDDFPEDGNRWVWFDWTCADTSDALGCAMARNYHVYTDLVTGDITGCAWNDTWGFICFDGLHQELPPRNVQMYVTLESSAGDSPETVDYSNAPLADGGDYWRVKVEFMDGDENLTAEEISSIAITPTASGHVFLNQVEDVGDAIEVSPKNSYLGCDSETEVCVLEDEGYATWNTFVYSQSPTSNMLGLNDDSDSAIDYFADRMGCRWIYFDQWHDVDGAFSQTDCPKLSSAWATPTQYDKEDVFYSRVNNRNQYILESLQIDVQFTNSNTVITPGTYVDMVDEDTYVFDVHGLSTSDVELSFRPRFQVTQFAAYYDGAEQDQISADYSKEMSLRAAATVVPTSAAFQANGGNDRPEMDVYYQLDTDSSKADSMTDEGMHLIMDSGSDDVADCTRRIDVLAVDSYGNSYSSTGDGYVLDYGQKDGTVDTTCSGYTPSDSLPPTRVTGPTAELWVCDKLNGRAYSLETTSCYYTAYLARMDRHVDAQTLEVIGAINSTIDADELLSNDSSLSVLGTTSIIKLRNKMYAQVLRYTLGKSAGSGRLGDAMTPAGSISTLMNGRLLYAEGDVVINGEDSPFSAKTLVVVGGDVTITRNVTGGRLGVVVFEDNEGNGGNVYIAPQVTDLYVNFFLDGALLSYDGVTTPESTIFEWDSDETRLMTLLNQLYVNGSVIAHNSILTPDSRPDGDSPATSWSDGSGNSTSDYSVAREYDLNQLRAYRRCWALNSDGTFSNSQEDCGEGAQLSRSETAAAYADDESYPPFILEYSPADELPIFSAETGLFN